MTDTVLMNRVMRRSAILGFCVSLFCAYFACGQISKTPDGLIYSIFPGQPTPSKGLLSALLRQVRWDTPQAGELNPRGLRLRFEKVDDQSVGATVPARYRVFADGAPENKVYSLSAWFVGQNLKLDPQDVYVNEQGLLMIHRPNPEQETHFKVPGDELYLMPPASTAEPIRYVLSSKDDELSILGTLVPRPLISQDQGCTLEVRIGEPDATAVLIVANGFPAQAKLQLVLESVGEDLHLTVGTNSSGHAELAEFPSVPGKAQGTLKVTAEGRNCLPSVDLPWGAGAHPDQKTQ
jgi:hypothetical protein